MDCRDAKELLGAYSDNELDARASRELESHLQNCADCGRAFAADQAVKKATAIAGLRRPAPDSLREMILSSVKNGGSRGNWNPMNLWGMAAALAIGVGLTVLATRGPGSASLSDADQALASHLRSLQNENHLVDVASTDQHTVKPWFDGKLDFAPPVRDLAEKGFPLVGGRTDFMHGRPVAALVYRRNKHIINLFIWPGESGESTREKQGYFLRHWSEGGMTFWAVSDLNAGELGQFQDLMRSN